MFAGDALPGIRVDIAPAPVAEALPRMDVAVFAGFAERGPCHVAIAVSSVAAYEAVFGGDCPLAYDQESGRRLTGNLAPTVRAFFSNGGTRCWAIRLAETTELADTRAAESGVPDPGSSPASAGSFLMPGLLCRLPAIDDNASIILPAMLGAASVGSWSDAMHLAARVSRRPVGITGQSKLRYGLRFADPGVLVPGDLIELTGGSGMVKRYAKVVRLADGDVLALWIASFARIVEAEEGPVVVKQGHASIAGETGVFPASLTEGSISTLTFADKNVPLVRGRWVRFQHQGEADWLRIDALRVDAVQDNKAFGPAWQQVASRMPGGPLAASKVTIDIAEHRPGADRVHTGLGPTPENVGAIHGLVAADIYHRDRANRTAAIRPGFAITGEETDLIAQGYGQAGFAEIAARFGTPAFTAADRLALRAAWLPVGLDPDFAEPCGAVPSSEDPLVRDGLSRFDKRIFLDPRLADLRGPALVERAQAIRDLGEQRIFGVHAAFDIDGDLFPEPSLLAVPDATQPGWEIEGTADNFPQPKPGAPALANWRNHSDGCAPSTTPELTAPDFSGFLDCSTRLLAAPELEPPQNPIATDDFTLSWSPGPAGSVAVLEEAARPDFTDAIELLREKNVSTYAVTGRAQGVHYYRLHFELDGNVSAYTAVKAVLRKARFAATRAEVKSPRLAALHAAILRIAAANGDFFAILSLPAHFRTADATGHARALATLAPGAGSPGQLGADEARLLSHGAIYHPWLVARNGTGLLSAPPDGAVAGLMATRARTRGAWIAPANDPLLDIVGLDPALPEPDLLSLDRARVNMIRQLPAGFMLHDADTLSPEREWRPINVRRLMMLLRRTLLRRGMTYVFEPNGPVLRRAVERSLTETLDDLQLRGAFAGASSAKSFRVAVQQSDADIDAGRLIVEVGVAPSQPIRFLTLRLVQQGARLSILEEA
jgi:hypothetical protein